MSFFVVCTFDLKNASRVDYENAYAELKRVGLKRTVVSNSGDTVVAPTTMTMGTFMGNSAASVRDSVRDAVQAAFQRQGLSSEILVVACGDWAWGAATTSASAFAAR